MEIEWKDLKWFTDKIGKVVVEHTNINPKHGRGYRTAIRIEDKYHALRLYTKQLATKNKFTELEIKTEE